MKVQKLIHASSSFSVEHCGMLLDAPPEGLVSEEGRPVVGFLKSCADINQFGWPYVSDQQDLLVEENSLTHAKIRSLGAHQQAVLFTHPSRLRCVLAPGSANQPHPASCWGCLPCLRHCCCWSNLSKCSLLSHAVFLLKINFGVLLLKSSVCT